MGMSASQARLLTLTARIHDVEFQAQAIQNSKLQLATESDQVYQDYLKAMDAQTLSLTFIDNGQKGLVPANFNNLCSHMRLDSADGTIYALRNRDGLLIVEDKVAQMYYSYKNDVPFRDRNPLSFTMYAMASEIGTDGNYSGDILGVFQCEEYTYQEIMSAPEGYAESDKIQLKSLHDQLEQITGHTTPEPYDHTVAGEEIPGAYDTNNFEYSNTELRKKYQETLTAYKDLLYRMASSEIWSKFVGDDGSGEDLAEFNSDEFDYYAEIFAQIDMCGGCVSIADYNGSFGDAASNTEWLEAQVACGNITIESVKKPSRRSHIVTGIDTVGVGSETVLSYQQTSKIDNTALAKAEAKYEHDMKEINQKDKRFDLSLSKLDTERNALKTEYDQVKKVASDNIERTFKIFS